MPRGGPGIPRLYARVNEDPFDHARYLPWLRMRAQANFREEPWDLSFKDFCRFWSTEAIWMQRGRGRDDLMLTREDPEAAWSLDNCVMMTRLDWSRKQNAKNRGKKYKQYKKL